MSKQRWLEFVLCFDGLVKQFNQSTNLDQLNNTTKAYTGIPSVQLLSFFYIPISISGQYNSFHRAFINTRYCCQFLWPTEINKDLIHNWNISMNNVEISCINKSKFLGVIIDDRLTWIHHIEHVSKKCQRQQEYYINCENSQTQKV